MLLECFGMFRDIAWWMLREVSGCFGIYPFRIIIRLKYLYKEKLYIYHFCNIFGIFKKDVKALGSNRIGA